MRTLDEALNQFAYHPATPDTAPLFAKIRDAYMDHLREIWVLIPDGPEKTLAIRKLQESQMYANLAVALTAPADLTNHAVARVLPSEAPVQSPGSCIGGDCRVEGPHTSDRCAV